ncbi:MAG: transcriptional activator NhaR [Gammaproteobacteria bacterium]|nr:transcriptional activator NhaR [Gammaproteobacteria bacterium]MDH5171352.1 transcriptional activator NhaR [Gammaproteobacteria bacterium]
MRHLNYNHLLYFWTVAREGSIAKATQSLHLTPQTISGQLKLLEDAVGEPLFNRVGRGLVMTETGHLVYQYADEIFTLGAELTSRVKTGRVVVPAVLAVGVVNSIPKLIASRILQPVLHSEIAIRLVCQEGGLEALLGDLAIHQLDLVLSDRPIPSGLSVKAFSHALGSSEIALFVRKGSNRQYEKDFPRSLDKAPILLPTMDNPIRRALDDWFDQQGISPTLVAEFEDSALMKAFGEAGNGIFPAPAAISEEVEQMYRCRRIGPAIAVEEKYYAISPERKLKHPAVLNIIENARRELLLR